MTDPFSVFPANVVALLVARLDQVLNAGVDDPVEHVQVQSRPITALDAGKIVAVLPVDWSTFGSDEMGTFPRDPHPIQDYGILVQCLVSDFDEAAGIGRLSLLSRRVRNTLVGDRVLHQALRSLRCTEDEILETFQALRVRRQTFLVNRDEKSTTALYLSATDVALLTEVAGPI